MDAPTIMAAAKAHVNLHLKQGCQELVIWNTTGVLPDGIVRATAKILQEAYGDTALCNAERLYEMAALREVAEG